MCPGGSVALRALGKLRSCMGGMFVIMTTPRNGCGKDLLGNGLGVHGEAGVPVVGRLRGEEVRLDVAETGKAVGYRRVRIWVYVCPCVEGHGMPPF